MWLLAVLGVGGLLLAALYYLVAGEANWWLYLLAVVSLVAVVVYGLVVSLSEVASMGPSALQIAATRGCCLCRSVKNPRVVGTEEFSAARGLGPSSCRLH